MDPQIIVEIKALLSEIESGILSTQSTQASGYPSGSFVTYALDKKGYPVVHLSALAEHTKNITENSKVCLTLVELKKDDLQNSKRLSLLADAEKVNEDNDVKERYYSRFPAAREYGENLDFSFYCLKPLKVRYISGPGRIFSLEASEL